MNSSTAAIGPLTDVALPRISSAVASSTIRPWSIITTRSSRSATSSIKWVDKTIVLGFAA
jgi:hypothetical protein